LQSKLALPLGQVYLNVLGKKGAMTIWCSIAVLQESAFTTKIMLRHLTSGQYLCGCSQVVDASRVVFAFSRDNALPGSRWWKRINHTTQTPVNAVWFALVLSAICGTLVFSTAAFNSLASYVEQIFQAIILIVALKGVRNRVVYLIRDTHLLSCYLGKGQTKAWPIQSRLVVFSDWLDRYYLGGIHGRHVALSIHTDVKCANHE
jgi:amino acid transporter